MSEMNSLFRELGTHERQAYLRDRARRERQGTVADHERRGLLRKITRHSS